MQVMTIVKVSSSTAGLPKLLVSAARMFCSGNSATAKAKIRICCRSTPRERQVRSTTATIEATKQKMQIAMSAWTNSASPPIP